MDSEIQALLNANTMSDLKRFIKQRQTLNSANWYLKYFFHSVQAAGLLTTSMAQSYGWSNFIWLGIGLNSLATLIHIYEQTNNSISKHMLKSIGRIKNGTYVDEDMLIDTEEDEKKSHLSAHVPLATAPIAFAPLATAPIPYAHIDVSSPI
jgi:hypothetical protein